MQATEVICHAGYQSQWKCRKSKAWPCQMPDNRDRSAPRSAQTQVSLTVYVACRRLKVPAPEKQLASEPNIAIKSCEASGTAKPSTDETGLQLPCCEEPEEKLSTPQPSRDKAAGELDEALPLGKLDMHDAGIVHK